MIRIKRGQKIRQQRKKLSFHSKGFTNANNRLYRLMKQKVCHAQTMMHQHRYQRKRIMRQLWIIRLNSVLRLNNTNYSQFIYHWHLNSLKINRKIICQLCLYENKFVIQSIINQCYEN